MIKYFSLFFLIFLPCCHSHNKTSMSNRQKYAQELVLNSKLEGYIIKTNNFSLQSYIHINNSLDKSLNIYIEGDGFSWKNRYTISDNPTPIDPLALKMAIADKNSNVAYIARPCQYVDLSIEPNCQSKFWSHSRFNKTVIDSINEAINRMVNYHKIKSINLYGYSGGGALAVLIASTRDDVKSIVTIAGNLNHQEFTKIHKVTPLYDSLNPIDFIKNIENIPSYHMAGGKDKIIPSYIIKDFVLKINQASNKCAKFTEIKGATHEFNKWPEILEELLKNPEAIKCEN